ncbi:OmpW family outer membrane protein [Cupriavidus necator]|uniref:OmpW/AlkL family protein n=1 Tax=Cupriavidus necator TaxID=106590 RepID=UPI00339D7D03
MERWRYAGTMSLVSAVLIAAMGSSAHAQSAGDNVVSVGWAHIAPQTGSDPVKVTSIGGVSMNSEVPGSSVGARSLETVGILAEHYFTDHIGVALLGGFPMRTQLEGRGTFGGYGVLGDARTWSPELLLRYHFGQPESRFRPFAGVGVSYTWFTNARVTNDAFITQRFGPGGSATAEASSSWSPVVQVGLDYRISKHWSVGALVGYMPSDTNVTLKGRTAQGVEVVSQTKVRLRPIITFLSVSYTF